MATCRGRFPRCARPPLPVFADNGTTTRRTRATSRQFAFIDPPALLIGSNGLRGHLRFRGYGGPRPASGAGFEISHAPSSRPSSLIPLLPPSRMKTIDAAGRDCLELKYGSPVSAR